MDMHNTRERDTHPKARALDLIYAGAYGFCIGFCLAAGIGIILAWAIKATEGLDGE